MRSTYSVSVPNVRTDGTFFESKGIVKVYRKGTARLARTYAYSLKKAVHQANDRIASRATERFWYFGNRAALDFGVSGNTVTPFYNTSPACDTWCIAPEGSTVVTNSQGELIFWTNGQTVWDRAGNVLQNSTGLNADSSATQAATSFPLGKSGTKYAIVTNTSYNSKRTGSYNGAGELHSVGRDVHVVVDTRESDTGDVAKLVRECERLLSQLEHLPVGNQLEAALAVE